MIIFLQIQSHIIYQTPGIVITDVSDHLPVFVTTDLKVYRDTNNTVETEIRKLNDINMQTFKSELSKVNWEHECAWDDVNEVYEHFIGNFNNLYDKCCPKSTKRVNNQKERLNHLG